MKALDILKNLKNEMQNNDGIINWDCSYEYFKKVDNAIKELEDLQNRTCKNCKFGMTYHFDDEVECFKIESDTQGMYFSNDFCCNKWESK